MKKILLIFLFLVSLAAANAQDKIITIKQDTIACRIVSVNAERISYEQKTSDQVFVGKSILIADVLQYVRTARSGNFGEGFVHQKPIRERPAHRWLFSLQGGLSHSYTDFSYLKNMLLNSGNSASATDDYTRKLENGASVNTSLHYLLTTFLGLGLDYNLFYSASKAEFMSPGYGQINLPLYIKIGLDERLYTQFAGPSVLLQQFPDKKRKIKISETLSPGVVLFRDESRGSQFQAYWGTQDSYNGQPPQYYDQANSISTSTSYGAKGSLSLEYGITPQLSAGLAGNFMWAKLHKISTKTSVSRTNDQKLENPITVSHIDYGFIVRYNF
ncbi:MAG TPA: hypothetical protein VGK10_10040 [Prolixibacteraceae bacterium]|jgi:hypothetical protein